MIAKALEEWSDDNHLDYVDMGAGSATEQTNEPMSDDLQFRFCDLCDSAKK